MSNSARWNDMRRPRDEDGASRDGNFAQILLKRTAPWARVKMFAHNQVGKLQVEMVVLMVFVLLKCLNFPPAWASPNNADELQLQGTNQANYDALDPNETRAANNASKVAKAMAELNSETSDQVPLYMQHMKVILVTLHLSVFVTGLVGNSLVCLSVYRNKSLQTITNYYIVNLAVADFLVILICLPPTVYWDLTLFWNFGLVLCKMVLYLQSISVSVSVLTLTCISLDRWYAICRPLKFSSSKSRAKSTIGFIWLVSMIIASPDVIFLTTKPVYEENDYVYMDCTYSWPESVTKIHQLCIVTLLFVLPFVLMTISYSEIVNVLWRNETMAETMQNSMQLEQDGAEKQSKSMSHINKSLKMRLNESTIISTTTRSNAQELPLEKQPPPTGRQPDDGPDNLRAITKGRQTGSRLGNYLDEESEQSNSAPVGVAQSGQRRHKLTRIMRRPINCIIRAKMSLTRSTTLTTIASTSSASNSITPPAPSQRKVTQTAETKLYFGCIKNMPESPDRNYDKDKPNSTLRTNKPTEIRVNLACCPDERTKKSFPDGSHLKAAAAPLLQFNLIKLDQKKLVYELDDASLLAATKQRQQDTINVGRMTTTNNNDIFPNLLPGAGFREKTNLLVSSRQNGGQENCSLTSEGHRILSNCGVNQFNLTSRHSNKTNLHDLVIGQQNQLRATTQNGNDARACVGSLQADVQSCNGGFDDDDDDDELHEMRSQMGEIREIPTRASQHHQTSRRASDETTATTIAPANTRTNYRPTGHSVEVLWMPNELTAATANNNEQGDQMIRGLVISLGPTTTLPGRERADDDGDERPMRPTRSNDLGARVSQSDHGDTFASCERSDEHGRVCSKELTNGSRLETTMTSERKHLYLACADEVSQPQELAPKGAPKRSNQTITNKRANHQNPNHRRRQHHRLNNHHHHHHRHHRGYQHHQSVSSCCERLPLASCNSHGSIELLGREPVCGSPSECWRHQRPNSASTSPCGPHYHCLDSPSSAQSPKQFATLGRRRRRSTSQRRRRLRDDDDDEAGHCSRMGLPNGNCADGDKQQQQLLLSLERGRDFRRRPSPAATLAALSDGCSQTTATSIRSDQADQRRSHCDYSNGGGTSPPQLTNPLVCGGCKGEIELNEHNDPADSRQHPLCHHARSLGRLSSDQDAQVERRRRRLCQRRRKELSTDMTNEGIGQRGDWTGNGTDDVRQEDISPGREYVYVAAVGGNEINWPLCNGSGGGQLALEMVVSGGPIQSTSKDDDADEEVQGLSATKSKSYDLSAPMGRNSSFEAPGHVCRVGPLNGGGGNRSEQLSAESSLSSNSLLVHETLLSSTSAGDKQRPESAPAVASIEQLAGNQLDGHLNQQHCACQLINARPMESVAPLGACNLGPSNVTLSVPKQSLADGDDNSPARLVRIATNVVRLTPLTSAVDGIGRCHVRKLRRGSEESYRFAKQRSELQPIGQLDQRQPIDRSRNLGRDCSVCGCFSGELPHTRYNEATAQMAGEDYATANKQQRELLSDEAAAETRLNQRVPSSSCLMRDAQQEPKSGAPNCDGAKSKSCEGAAAGAYHHQKNHPTTAAAGRLQVQLIRSPRSSSAASLASNNGTTTQNSLNHHHPHCQSHQPATSGRYYKLIESRKKAAKMLIVIVIMFGLCYLPVHFLNILRYTTGLPQNDLTMIASLVSHWLCYFNSAVNPLIYNFMSGKFRHEFANLFFCQFLRRGANNT